jgi:predicted DNA binding CopG/RHH family protein
MVQAIGVRAEKFMKKKIEYTDEPIGKTRRVKDFLPPPEGLVLKENNTKVTISLSHRSIEFFKNEAKKHHTQYQKMIRNLLDEYVARHNK